MVMAQMEKVVLLNALVTSSRIPLTIKTQPVGLGDVKYYMEGKEILSYIGHEATASLLTQLLGKPIPSNRAMYEPKPNEKAIVVKLKRRLERPEDLMNVKEEEIEFLLVEYSNY